MLPKQTTESRGAKRQDLRDVFIFTFEDLRANREGEISAAQLEKLRRIRLASAWSSSVFILVALALIYAAIRGYML